MRKIKEVTLSSKGQVTIPIEIRNFLNVKCGDSISFFIDDNEIKLTNSNNIDIQLKNDKMKTSIKRGKNNGCK